MPKKRQELKEISVKDAEDMLSADFYGLADLVECGIFDAYTFAQTALRNGEIEFHKVNSRDQFMTRAQVLEYVKKFRGPKAPKPQLELKFKCTPEERDVVDEIVKKVQQHEKLFSVEDLFRNIIQELSRSHFSYEKQQHIYKTNQ